MILDEAMERRIAEIVAGFARRMKFDPEGLRDGTRKQAMVPEGSIALDPAGTAPGLVVEAGGPIVIVLPGPPRELQAMWPAAVAAAPVAAVLGRADSYAVETMKMFGIPESTLAKTLREIERDVDLDPLEITTCLRRGSELEIDVRYRATDHGAARVAVRRPSRAPRPLHLHRAGREHRRARRRAARRAARSPSRSRAPAGCWPPG